MKRNSSVLVVGSIAFDTLRTPSRYAERVLGGSLNYFSITASLFCSVKAVGVVGEDFPQAHLEWMTKRGIDVSGIERVAGKTFFWKGSYDEHFDEAHTLETRLNVFETFNPILNEDHRKSGYIFLANIDPLLQEQVLQQIHNADAEAPACVALDTMNYWISKPHLPGLLRVLKKTDIMSLNEKEALLLSGKDNLLDAGSTILELGPKAVFVKRGELGAVLFTPMGYVMAPAFLVREVVDPTGAGDCFAAGMMSSLIQSNFQRDQFQTEPETWFRNLKRALIQGSIIASFAIEDISIQRIQHLEIHEFKNRLEAYKNSLLNAADCS